MMDWLQMVVQGGSLVVLSVVLYGAWKLAGRLLDMMKAQSEYIRSSTEVQATLCERMAGHENRAGERHQEMMETLRSLNGKSKAPA